MHPEKHCSKVSIFPIAEQALVGAISEEIASLSNPGRPLKYPAWTDNNNNRVTYKSKTVNGASIFKDVTFPTKKQKRTDDLGKHPNAKLQFF